MRTFGLIGYPLSHSFSKKYFTEKFEKEKISDCRYNNYSIESIEMLHDIIKNENTICGLNVTIPYKEKVIQYMDEMDDAAAEIGAVNTIKVYYDGAMKLKGFNTDCYGFYESIKPFLNKKHKKALILGTGGASKAVAYSLKELGIEYSYVSRYPKNKEHLSYFNLNNILNEYMVIVNTSPLGMYPNIDSFPEIPYNEIGKEHILYDLVYNPEETVFLKKGKLKGAVTINGLNMLHLQAEKAWEIWNNM